MQTELSFLLDLLLNDETPLPIKKLLKDRIKEVELNLVNVPMPNMGVRLTNSPGAVNKVQLPNPTGVPQSASTLAALARHAAEESHVVAPIIPEQAQIPEVQEQAGEPLAVPKVIAKTAATAAALQDRQAAISAQVSGKPEKGRTSPRKF